MTPRGNVEQQQSVSNGAGNPGDLVGSVLAGRYQIVAKLGEGAMGVVYLGEHLRIGRRDAIKVLRGSLQTDPEALARFNRGARNVSSILHPNVCTLYDYSTMEDGTPFVAMELIEGESLKDLLDREGVLPLQRAVDITVQTAAALQAAHDRGVVHRDLKPGNIMLCKGRDGSDVVKVVDFDIAKSADESEEREVTRFGYVIGTVEYMSPEQLGGQRLDGRSDLYSLALILFRMLTGRLPVRAENTQEIMVQRLTQPALRLSEVANGWGYPDALDHVLARAMAMSPESRQPDVSTLAQEIAASVAGAGEGHVAGAASTGSAAAGNGHSKSLAETRLSPVSGRADVSPAPAVSDSGQKGSGSSRRGMYIAAGVVAVAGLSAVFFVAQSGGRALAGTAAADSVVVAPIAAEADPVVSTAFVASDEASDTRPQREPGPRPASDPPEEVRPSSGPSAEAERPAPVQQFSNAEADDILFRQMDRISPTAGASVMAAVRDTAERIFRQAQASDQVKARAAYTVGLSWIDAGDPSRAVEWLRRAVALDPTQKGYASALDGALSAAPR